MKGNKAEFCEAGEEITLEILDKAGVTFEVLKFFQFREATSINLNSSILCQIQSFYCCHMLKEGFVNFLYSRIIQVQNFQSCQVLKMVSCNEI